MDNGISALPGVLCCDDGTYSLWYVKDFYHDHSTIVVVR